MRARALAAPLLAGVGCLGFEPPAEPVRVLGVGPQPLPPRQALIVRVDREVGWIEPPGGVDVWLEDGRPVAFVARPEADARAIRVEPDPRWPDAPRLAVALREGLVDPSGRPLPVDTSSRTVALALAPAPTPIPRVLRVAPPSGWAAPEGLVHLGLVVEPPGEVSGLWLRSGSRRRELRVEAEWSGHLRARVDGAGGLAAGLWTLQAPASVRPADGSAGQIDVSSYPDRAAPSLVDRSQWVEAEALAVHVEADEPFFVRGTVSTAAGTAEGEWTLPPFALRAMTVRVRPVAPETMHRIELTLVDLSGNARVLPETVLRSAPHLDVEVTEVVASPLRDWGDSEPAGRPFDPLPGDGPVSDTDEWIELVNRSNRPLDLRRVRLHLETLDGTPAVTALAEPPGAYFGAGGGPSRWLPGEALVVRPRGAMSSKDLSVRLVSGERVLADVRLAETAADHPGGSPPDATHEAVARTATGDWAWCRPSPGDPTAPADCRD